MNKIDFKNDPSWIIALGMFILIMIAFLYEDSLNWINTSFTGILVLVTFIYTTITASILKDSQKAQKIRFIENQLSNFYYPAIHILQIIHDDFYRSNGLFYLKGDELVIHKKEVMMDNPVFKQDYPELLTQVAPLINYQYLIQSNSKQDFVKFIDCIYGKKESSVYILKSDETMELKNKFNSDINSLNKELENLVH